MDDNALNDAIKTFKEKNSFSPCSSDVKFCKEAISGGSYTPYTSLYNYGFYERDMYENYLKGLKNREEIRRKNN